MKPEKPKKLVLLSAISLCGFVLFLFIALIFARSYQGEWERRDLSFSLSDEKTGEVILSCESSTSLPAGERSLLIKNSENEDLSFTLFQSGREKGLITLSAEEEKEILVDSDGSALSLIVKGEDQTVAYLSDAAGFSAVAKKMKNGGDLIFLKTVQLEEAFLSAPFRLFGSFSFQSLSVESEEKGSVAVCPDKSFRGTLYVSAPRCKVFWKEYSPAFSADEYNYYLKAESVNGTSLSSEEYPISSDEQLARLASDQLLPKLSDGAVLQFSKAFSLKDSYSFSALVSLDFSAPVDFSGNTLTFSSSKKGVYEVKTALGAGIDGASLLFDSPRSALLWEGEGTLPSVSTVAKFSNVKSYNGKALPLGGEGKAIPELTLKAEGIGVLFEDVTFRVKGNLLCASLPYLVSRDSLKNASFALSCDNGTATVQGDISSGVIVTKDSEGKERRFAVEVCRDPYNIPVVHLETENGVAITSKSQYVSATFSLDGSGSEYQSLGETHIRIRGRGNSTWNWEKKPYKIHFDEPTSLLGLPAAEEWALISNYADKSLMRNHLAQVMASTLSFSYCPTQVCVDVFLNGEYLGVYTLGEHLEAGEGRVEVDYDMNRTDCGYFLEVGGVVTGVDVKGMNYFHAGLLEFVLIKTPESNALTSEQFDYIHQYMLSADEAVKAGEGYEEYLDVDSVIDWMIMTELSCNTDCSWRRSTFFTKQPGGKLVMGPVWDFDLAFGNFSRDNPGDDTWVSTEPDDDYVGETWSTHLLQDPEFQARFKARWLEVRDTLVNTALEEIEEQYSIVSPSAELNFKRWDILGKKVAFERRDTVDYLTYSSHIYYLQEFIVNRAAWIDSQIENFA